MPAVPKRKPLPPSVGQNSEVKVDPVVPAHSNLVATSITHVKPKEDEVTQPLAGSPTSHMKRDELIVKRATLEQLTYLLLDLVTGLPHNGTAVPQSTDARAEAAHLLTAASLSSTETIKPPQTYTSHEVLKLDINQRDGVSKELLQRKPWQNEPVITIESIEIMNHASSAEVQEEVDVDPIAGVESIPLHIGKHAPTQRKRHTF